MTDQPSDKLDAVERLERVERQLAIGNGAYEAHDGRLLYRIERDDLRAVLALARQASQPTDKMEMVERARDVFFATIQRARKAGESNEMLARWLSEDHHRLIAALSDQP